MRTLTMDEPPVLDYSGRESLNMICTNLSFIGKDKKRILVTSCVAGEGKSTMALRIAQNLAYRGKKVLLVDTDMRKSHMVEERKLHANGDILGLAHYLAGHCSIDDIVYQVEGLEGVDLVPVGRIVVNSIQLLDGPMLGELLDKLAGNYDMVLVDTPPIGLVIDAAVIARNCDGAIIVVEYGKRHRGELQASVSQMNQADCPIIGCIIDKITVTTGSQKQYYKSHYYYGKYGKYNSYYNNDKK